MLNQLKMPAAFCTVILSWAYSPIGIRTALLSYSPEHVALLRFMIASVLIGCLAIVFKVRLPRIRDIPLLILLGFFAVALHHIALNTGQLGVSAGAASVLAQSTPLFSSLIAWFFLKEQINKWHWLCIITGFCGAVIVIQANSGFLKINLHGVLILLAALSWSIYFSIQKKYSTLYPAFDMVCYTIWAGTLLLLIYSRGVLTEIMQASVQANSALLLLGMFPSAVAYMAWAFVLKHVELSIASSGLYLIPPVSILMSVLLLNEKITATLMAGGLIIMLSVVLINMQRLHIFGNQ